MNDMSFLQAGCSLISGVNIPKIWSCYIYANFQEFWLLICLQIDCFQALKTTKYLYNMTKWSPPPLMLIYVLA